MLEGVRDDGGFQVVWRQAVRLLTSHALMRQWQGSTGIGREGGNEGGNDGRGRERGMGDGGRKGGGRRKYEHTRLVSYTRKKLIEASVVCACHVGVCG